MSTENTNEKTGRKHIWCSIAAVLVVIAVLISAFVFIIPAITRGKTPISDELMVSESGVASDGAAVAIKGHLPTNAEATIKTVDMTEEFTSLIGNESSSIMKDYVAYDIKIMVGEDEWQPDRNVNVVLKNPGITVGSSDSLAVAQIDGETGKVSNIKAELSDNGDIAFETDVFSTYILYTVGPDAYGPDDKAVILACSDVQDPSNSYLFNNGNYSDQNKLLKNIITQVQKVYPTIDGFFCGGDYNFDVTREGRQYNENGVDKTYTAASALSRTQQNVGIFYDAIKRFIPTLDDEKITLIQGNHDVFCDGLTQTGGYDKGVYSVYVINEQSFPSGDTATQSLCQQTADGLRSWLNGLKQANSNKPVFILSHVPLHYSTRVITDGDAVYAQLLYDAIESYGNDLNIIFLYGHDHAHGDDDYLGGSSQFLTRGDKITIANSGSRTNTLEKTLNFTYMNYGFVGYFWDTWGQQSGTINRNTDYTLTMTTFEINGSDVIIRRWDENGQHILKAAGAASQGDRGIADPLAPNTKTYASPQLVRSPGNSTQTISYIESTDSNTNVTVRAFGSSYSVEKKTNLQAMADAGITDYLAYDIKVQDFVGSAQITMPSKSGYNKVWYVRPDGTLEEVEDARFNGNSVTFTANHFSIYANGVEVPLNDGDWYLVKTPASELQPGDTVLVLSNDESFILYPGEDCAWPDPGPIPSAYTEYYGGVLESIEYNGKTYYPYDANLQDYCSESALTVTSSMGLKNCNGKILDLNFNADNWDQTFFQSGGAVINADGTITQTIGGTKHYLTFDPATDRGISFRSSTSNSQYAQLVFYRLEQFEAPEPEDDDYQIVGGDGRLSDLEDFTYRTVKAAGDACLYHTNTVVTPQTPFANGTNDKIEFYNAFVVDGHTYNVCMKVKFNNPPANTQLYWGAKTYSTEWGYISLGQFRNTPTYYEWWTEADMYEPETDIDWELWLEDANGNRIDDARLFQETGYHLAGGSVYVSPNEYVSVYSRDNTLYTNVPEGIEFDTAEGRWHTIDDAHNLPEDYLAGIADSDGVVKGTYRKDFTDAGCELALGTYGRVVPVEPEEPDIPEGVWTGDIDFKKSEITTDATGIQGSQTGTENVHTICLDIVPPEKKDIAILMLMDTTSSMRVQCANCGVPSDRHNYSGQSCEVTNWNGTTTTVYACDHFVERKGVSEAAAREFISKLGNLPNQNGKVYIRLVPFAGQAYPDYNNGNWIDVTANGGVAAAQTALANLPQYSGTNVSAGMRSAYEILSNNLPSGVTSENTYVLLLTDGAQSVSDLSNLPAAATTQSYINSWLNKWSSYNHYEYVDPTNDHVDAGYYIGAPYYAELITDDNGLNSHLYTVMLGNNLDWGAKTDFENWRYIAGIGIAAHDHLKSFSDYSLYATSGNELTAYYNSILYALTPTLDSLSVTDPMSDHVDFLTFTDSNGTQVNNSVATYNPQTRTITWNPQDAVADPDGHYRLYYNVRIKTEATGFVDGQLYPANDTTTATYTLMFPDGHTESGEKEADIPEISGKLGQLSFTKTSQNGTNLSGAQFKLVHDSNCPYCHGATFGDITFSSGANGTVSVSNIPSGHTYKLYETAAPDGYLPFSGALSVDVSYGVVTVSGSSEIWNEQNQKLIDKAFDPAAAQFTVSKDFTGNGGSGSPTFAFDLYPANSSGTKTGSLIE
ncbi:MAG: metallophosphoesterase, partial [Clostridia bacterium]|nr:metallophosphoesterase [Clostridia bacterium]